MKIYKIILPHEAGAGDLFISTGAANLFAREVLNNEQALEYEPEEVAIKPKSKRGGKRPGAGKKPKQKEYRCEECEDLFFSSENYRKVVCPSCGGKKLWTI